MRSFITTFSKHRQVATQSAPYYRVEQETITISDWRLEHSMMGWNWKLQGECRELYSYLIFVRIADLTLKDTAHFIKLDRS